MEQYKLKQQLIDKAMEIRKTKLIYSLFDFFLFVLIDIFIIKRNESSFKSNYAKFGFWRIKNVCQRFKQRQKDRKNM